MSSIFDSFDPPTVYAALTEVPQVLTAITPDTFRLLTIFITNVSSQDRTITITNTAGVELIKDMYLPANQPAPLLQFPYMNVVGLKWIADGAGVNGQVEGFPDE